MLISERFGFIALPIAIVGATVCCLAFQKWETQRIDAEHSSGADFIGAFLNDATWSTLLRLVLPDKPGFVSIDDIIKSKDANNSVIRSNPNQYLYLAFLPESEEDLSDLARYCVNSATDGQAKAEIIPLSSPRGDGRNALLRASLIKDRPAGSAWSNWYRDASKVPVFVERSCLEGKGGYVIFLDGSFKYFPYAKGSVWPLTRDGLRSIKTIANPVPDTK